MTESELLTISKTERYSYLTAIILASIAFMITLNNTAETVSVQSENIVLPVIMYHGFTSESDESEYVLNIVDFEKDIRYLNEEGFAFVTAREVAEFTSGNGTLPSKPVMLTFDDGYLNNYTEAFPILKKYNAKAVISPVMYFSEADNCNNKRNPAYSNLNFDEIKKMSDSGLIEFQNHSYNLHSINHTRHGSGKSKNESQDEYRKIFYADTIKSHFLLKQITGEAPIAYTYPFGNISDESKTILKCMGYKLALGCAEGINILKQNNDEICVLKRFNRTPKKSIKDFFSIDYM